MTDHTEREAAADLARTLNAADVDYSAREHRADAGDGDMEPGDWFTFIARAALAWMRENGYEKREPVTPREKPEGWARGDIPQDHSKSSAFAHGYRDGWDAAREPVVVDDAMVDRFNRAYREHTQTIDEKRSAEYLILWRCVCGNPLTPHHRIRAALTAALTPDGQETER